MFRSEFHVIGVILVAMTTIAKGNWPSVINLHGVYPNLVISFWSSLYLIQLRKVYLYIHNCMFDKNVMQSYIGCMTFWPLSLPLLSLWWFIISSRLILIPCRMPFESCLCHFVGEWELFFGIRVHFKELYVFVYPNLVNIFWSNLDLISTEQCLFQCVQLHVRQWFMYHFRLKWLWYHEPEFCMTFWPFSLPIMSMWSFFISPRLTLIPFRMHFESCWYNLSDCWIFLCFLCMYQWI